MLEVTPFFIGLTLVTVALGSLTQSVFGFGFAIVCMPLLALFMDPILVTPFVALCGSVVNSFILYHTRADVNWKASGKLLLGSLLGLPFGLLFLTQLPKSIVVGCLGFFLFAYAMLRFSKMILPLLRNRFWVYPFGLITGALVGAYNIGGPTVVIFGTMYRWGPDEFRATLQGFFFPITLAAVAGHAITGLWNYDIFLLWGASVPILITFFYIGTRIHGKIKNRNFDIWLNGMMALFGILLFIKAMEWV